METLKEKIMKQEKQDRYVASECLKKLLNKGSNLSIIPTPLTDAVDLNCSVVNLNGKYVPFNVEIKERNKTDWQLSKYPQAELKVEKYERMRKATPAGVKLLYMVLLNNQKCLLFDLDKLDWNKVTETIWYIKKTQMKEDSPVVPTPTYLIPYDLAIATCDCWEFVEYYKNNLAN